MSDAGATVGDVVRRGLAALGVRDAYGAPYPGLDVAPVDDPAVADVLAEAHLLVHRDRCALHRGDGHFTVLDRAAVLGRPPGVGAGVEDLAGLADCWADTGVGVAVDDLVGLADCWAEAGERLAGAAGAAGGPGAAAAVDVVVSLDPGTPAAGVVVRRPAAVDRWVTPEPRVAALLDAAAAPVLLVGPGVADPALVSGLHALAARAGLGVLNTWGAKGVFDWRSVHHWATVGLQARDLRLAGVPAADVVLTAGLDPREVPPGVGPDTGVTVAPGALGALAEALRGPVRTPEVPPLRTELARVTQEGWAVTTGPLPPSRVTRAYAAALGGAGLVAADPGTAGFWVARTFATTTLGGAVVPARAFAHGMAAACVAVARRRWPDRPALAVVDADADAGTQPGEMTARVVEVAARWGLAVPVEVWGDGPALDAEAHAARLDQLVTGPGSPAAGLAVDEGQMARMVAVAGDVVAWRDDDGGGDR